MAASTSTLQYKGYPLRRKDNIIYYGNMSDKYIIMLQVLSSKDVNGMDVADRVLVSLQLTDPEIRSKDRIVKSSEKNGLYEAMDVAAVWLERALAAS